MRLQHSRSAVVIVTPGRTHAITGRAANNTARIAMPALAVCLTTISLVQAILRGNATVPERG